ncbi:dehydrodolichyl diphosphate synthase complex subunit nus1 [Lingula anatina]|uniref:ditrans,polycis-polyprenyl diphosphate synthase [(2E,6E)-farnesyldiphosphate specific] n=1 Tax=Lingula anatina TaxID=7574 RepID=A0A1S3IC12_LINAN|nr:dehydrodolichyl diphosphate synthase complex subunit nus1 [Lingula anatina]|eukprot:XP_013394964.1 dehydrodolichyl diphosphate synthase complex subunit nus1 [Lingula anatina]
MNVLWICSWIKHVAKPWAPFKGRDVQSYDSKSLKRLPIHLGVIILEDNISYIDIANIIIWCMTLGISYISVYDRKGVIRQNQKHLAEEIHKRKEELYKKRRESFNINVYNGLYDSSKYTGPSSSNSSDVQLLSEEDGQLSLVQVAKEISKSVKEKRWKVEDVSLQNVENYLLEKSRFPDPDLVIKFGAAECLMGFLPWQIRLTEFFVSPSHRGLSYKTFLSLLQDYGNTRQRFGK